MSRPGLRDHLRALVYLTGDVFRRLLRQSLVVRSLVFPSAIATFSLLATVLFVVWTTVPAQVALTPEAATPQMLDAIEEAGFGSVTVDDPRTHVADGNAVLGTDGKALWVSHSGRPPAILESVVRDQIGAYWRPDPRQRTRTAAVTNEGAARPLLVFIGALFSIYGVVFAAGGVARDRSQGTLDAELAMAVPHMIHGLARWLSSTMVLSLFYAFSVYLLNATLGVSDPVAYTLHGTAACAVSAAIGLFVVGRSGLDKGFAGILAAGMFTWLGWVGLGMGARAFGAYMPGPSLFITEDRTAIPLVLACAAGVVASYVFARRTAVQ